MMLLFTLSSLLCLSMVRCDHASGTGDLPIEKPPITHTVIPESAKVPRDDGKIIIIDDPPPPPSPSKEAPVVGIDPEAFLASGGVDINQFANLDPQKLNAVLDNVLTTVKNELRATGTPVDQGAPSGESSNDVIPPLVATSNGSSTDTRTAEQKQIDNILQTFSFNDLNSNVKSDGFELPAIGDLPVIATPAETKPDLAGQIAKEIQSASKAFQSEVGSVDTNQIENDMRGLQNTLRSSIFTQQPELRDPTLTLPETSQDDDFQKVNTVINQLERERIASESQPILGNIPSDRSQTENSLNIGFDNDDARKLTQLIERRRELLRLLREQEQRTNTNTATPNGLFSTRAPFRNINRAAIAQPFNIDDFGNSLDDIPSVRSPLVGNSISVGRNIITDSENQRNTLAFNALVEAGRVNAPEDIRQRFSDDDGQSNRPSPIPRLQERTEERPGVGPARNFIEGAIRGGPNIRQISFLPTVNSIQAGDTDDSPDAMSLQVLLQQQRNALLTRRQLLEERLSRFSRPVPQGLPNENGFRPRFNPRPLPSGIRRDNFDDGNIRRFFNQPLGRRFGEDDNRIRFIPMANVIRGNIGSRSADDDNITPMSRFNRLREQRSRARLPSQNFRLPLQRNAMDDIDESSFNRFHGQGPLSNGRRLTRFRQRGGSLGLSGFSSSGDDVRRFVDTTPRMFQTRRNVGRLFTRQTDSPTPSTSLQSTSANIRQSPLSPTRLDSDDDSNPPSPLDNVNRQPPSTGREQQSESNSVVTQSYGDFPEFNRQVEQLLGGVSGFDSVSFTEFGDDDFATQQRPISMTSPNQRWRENPRRVAFSPQRSPLF
ncbi:uncharacterized protein LOC130051084 [Ostrea edulis]|uniref:uncharacterized protein LOC130051084 n=1 Tax=Ostrea edulis TaxID=37623 RepID=UPI0024AFEFB8|nr:uncharacterized protein LOC130051084 [Ostrea edulis]